MKSLLGLLALLVAAAGFGIAWQLATRTGASWFDAQWLFLAALPYNWITLRIFGESNFAPDVWTQVGAALAVDAALAYLAGALVEALARGGWRLLRLIVRA